MAEVHNVTVVKFAEASKAYQALSLLKESDPDTGLGPNRAASRAECLA